MKMFILLSLLGSLSFASLAMANTMGTADRVSYIIILKNNQSESELNACMEAICKLSGPVEPMKCSIISPRLRLVSATLSNASAQEVSQLQCVKSLSPERTDYQPRPRIGFSN